MNSLLNGNHPIVLFVVVFLPVLLAWRLLSRSPGKPAKWLASPTESGPHVSQVALRQEGNPGSTSAAASGGEYPPDPTGIVAEVCSLFSPVREEVEHSYRGRRVRWTLSLSAISEREGQDATHTVRMYPSGRSPFSCGVYFSANAEECAVLQAARQNDAFVVEGIIDKVEDRDIDLIDVRMALPKAA